MRRLAPRFFALAALLPLLARGGERPEPRFAAPDFDAGTVTMGTVIRHTFTITNSGPEPLTVTEVKPSCGCTTPDYTRAPIPPAGRGEVTLEIHPYGPGEFVKSATVLFTHPDETRQTLSIRFKVVRLIEATPERIFLPAAAAFERAELPPITVKVGMAGKALASPSVTDLPAGTRASLSPVTAGLEYRLNFKIDPGHQPGETLEGRLTVKTGMVDQPALEIPYTIAFRGKVQLTPDRLTWGVIPADRLKINPENYLMRVRIDYPGGAGKPLRLGRPVSSTPAVRIVGVEEPIPGRQYELRVALVPGTAPGEVRGTVTLPTSETTMRKIAIPIAATIR